MNRLKSENPRSPFVMYIAVILGAMVAAGGGVSYAIFMNRQVETSREIRRVQGRIKERELEISTTRMRISEALNRYKVKDDLARVHSTLRPIPRGAVEDVRPVEPRDVVSAVP